MSIILIATMLCSVSNPDYNPTKSETRNVAICNRELSSSAKSRIYERDGITDRRGYCINHIVPLAIGGSNHFDNLEAMQVDQNGMCHAGGEVEAINCFLKEECSQQEALEMLGIE
jgi:hypothetical protein